ncbi:MAG: histidine--tRNA ligase [Syntrophorhabdaceae bacterium]|nr:histidine--tRNA ligase [Syntrophorhabdaceae bacterium]
MEKIRTLRGFRDIFGEELDKFRRIERVFRKYSGLLGFREIELPVLEKTELFVRSIGDTTDIVEKEMFTFTDVGGDSLTMRPEATAGMVRSYLQEGLYATERMTKVSSIGPMFRHERPQKGRYREFHQIDVEVFGIKEALVDAELIFMIRRILDELDIERYRIEVNSVGCKTCRESFRKVLMDFFETRKHELCEDCLRRLERNPLRIFDCKNEQCIRVTGDSPLLFDSLCGECKDHFGLFERYVKEFGIDVEINKRLVRGLDYYTKTVFEVTSEDLGAQKAFIAGGRYDNLVEEMGGPATAGIGFAIGVERLGMLVPNSPEKAEKRCFFACVGDRARDYLISFLRVCIPEGIALKYAYDAKSLKAQMRYADNLKCDFVLILGDDEIEKGTITLRNMADKSQQEFPLDPEKVIEEIRRQVMGNP